MLSSFEFEAHAVSPPSPCARQISVLMSAKYYDQLIARTQRVLARWHGADARLREITAHHATLRIVLTRGVGNKNLVISCLEPEDIRSPVVWQNAKIRIETAQMKNGEVGVVVLDSGVDFAVKAGTFEVAENVKLR